MDYRHDVITRWVATGSVEECVEQLRAFIEQGATTITLRLVGFDQQRQFDLVTQEVLPALT